MFIEGSLTAIPYRNTILSPVVIPFVQQNNLIFKQDNAKAHVARACREYLAANNIHVLNGPHTAQIYLQSNIYGTYLTDV